MYKQSFTTCTKAVHVYFNNKKSALELKFYIYFINRLRRNYLFYQLKLKTYF